MTVRALEDQLEEMGSDSTYSVSEQIYPTHVFLTFVRTALERRRDMTLQRGHDLALGALAAEIGFGCEVLKLHAGS